MAKKMTSGAFDEIVRKCFEHVPGYVFSDKNPVYLTYESFRILTGYNIQVQPTCPKEFNELAGKFSFELPLPFPKMLSVASSSRLCFMYFKRQGKTPLLPIFEKLLSLGIDTKTSAHLDAEDIVDKKRTYFECKCHEIFTDHEKFGFSKAYKEKMENDMKIENFRPGRDAYDSKTLLGTETLVKMFDVRQFICHLLGIAGKEGKRPCTLQYIFFRPNLGAFSKVSEDECQKRLDGVYGELEKEVRDVFRTPKITGFCDNNHISLAAKYVMLPDFEEKEDFATYPAK